ncbi:cysteine synthase family protein [Myxococcus sp. CA051A]|uniref:Cysteine synthase family protein n=1 Tax=Myxococcus llanfairpwllgwyngyllgogerychwyrndrobwllllantysiliogogogochensis TaxID=2590453 RepID=A0A540X5Q5_9BACT|nr:MULTISPECIES: cysteine synthase family protein [Myxococcus]NTX37763.1 cysteine synthase family protein [Myxococcus sp. CA033]NTX50649.1 cysteine synthase family protein [Myxococcus sp. CA039A]NTX61181.1 cysteine synthase family protein [Myxococcus sp. CA051A]TQF16559.1 cysteine synthase family protein [Myxococcus llanfairpwllgwyngyllgogerychwyrndrobwllllantysiliogogogochensis]
MRPPCRPLPADGRFLQAIAPTPLVPVRLDPEGPTIWCKLEFLNPSGSTKDRIARYMLEKAWRLGELQPGGEVVEASSGSTSIALALASAQMGVRFTAVMPEGVTDERVLTIRAYGGDVVLVPRAEGVRGAIAKAEQIARERKAFAPRQFENPDNAEAHRVWTGQEILSQIPGGLVHGVVSGVGTGGTVVGLYQAFAEAGCPVTAFIARPIAGLGCDIECCSFSPRVPGVVDGMSKLYRDSDMPGRVELDVSDEEAMCTARALIRRGFPVGPSSGLNYVAAVEASRRLGPGAQVVTVFPDRMERYFSTELIQHRPAPPRVVA